MHSCRAASASGAQIEWRVWQLADSAFPAGSFAHSGGLEAAWQQGRVAAGESLIGFLDAALGQAGNGSAPFVIAAHREPGRFGEFDRLGDALLTNHVANRASRAQGRSLLTAAERVFQEAGITRLRDNVRAEQLPAHLAPVFGRLSALLSIDEERAARLFLFCTLRGLVSSAVRLGIVGPMEGQAIQTGFACRTEQLLAQSRRLSPEAAAHTAPILDLLHGAHDRLYSRLFQS